MAVSLLVPDMPYEGVSYKYLKNLAREFVLKSSTPADFTRLVTVELGRETSKTRREALFSLKQRAIELFALDEG